MKTRDIINHRLRKCLNRPTAIAEVVSVLFFVSMGFWHVFWEGRSPETWAYRCGTAALVIVAGFDVVRYSRLSKKPVACPHCEKPLFPGHGWSRIPIEYKFCQACGASLDSEKHDGKLDETV